MEEISQQPFSPIKEVGDNLDQEISPTEIEGFMGMSEQNAPKIAETEEFDETKACLQLFQNYDPQSTGKITKENLIQILLSLGKDTSLVDDILKQAAIDPRNGIEFGQFIAILAEIQKIPDAALKFNDNVINQSSQAKATQKIIIAPDPKIIEFLRNLNEYIKKAESEGNYAEAKKAKAKMEETKLKEIERQQNNIKFLQEEELMNIENAQKAQFLDFTTAWDNYMADYETSAQQSLEKLKEKHTNEIKEFQAKLRDELSKSYKPSRQLIELRQKHIALGKMQKYAEAEKVKSQADALESWERNGKEAGYDEIIEKKTGSLLKQQQLAINVLLKRIQKDRNQQLVNRQTDTQKLILRNRNIRAELLAKHSLELKKAVESIRNTLSLLQVTKNNFTLDTSQITSSVRKDEISTSQRFKLYA